MKKFYFLSTCTTCQRISGHLELSAEFELQDIKKTPISSKQLEQLKELSGSYETLFSKRAKLYKDLGLKEKSLEEHDFKNYILEDYTFLKRPVLVLNDQLFIGNSSKVINSAKTALLNEKK
ncbi:MAG: Regulatory protein Spx [Formosa sp. Hel1_33_131]|jgi:arsenate reductase|nr:MAG: Regulatory protein Spx [Formosa sp. Hel1_33_131]|tara:strand:- start:7229 stop:7591 length:363 start_codon:yes stop_codon:yes gene_type:complete